MINKTVQQWKKVLSPQQFAILRLKQTQRPFTGSLLYNKLSGIYSCSACQNPLFKSDSKFDSGSGWPSFFRPIDKDAVKQIKDFSHGMQRIEIVCARCEGHLGHVFDDGPQPTGMRYCINSVCLKFAQGKTQQKL